MTEKSAFKHI